jgi:hypothetical protein
MIEETIIKVATSGGGAAVGAAIAVYAIHTLGLVKRVASPTNGNAVKSVAHNLNAECDRRMTEMHGDIEKLWSERSKDHELLCRLDERTITILREIREARPAQG